MENGQRETDYRETANDDQINNGGYTENPFENMEDGLCKRCRCRTIDRSENPESILCRDCREELIRLKIPHLFYLIGAVVILLAALTFATSMKGLNNLSAYHKSKGMAEDGYIITVLDNLLYILEENPQNKNLAIRLADLGMKYAYYDYAAYAIDNYLAGKEVSDSEYDKLTSYIRKLDAYYATYDLYEEIGEKILSNAANTEDTDKILEEFRRELSEYIGEGGYDQALLYYYLGYMSIDEKERISYLQECISRNPYFYDAQAQIATYYRRNGELEKARRQLEEIYQVNKEDYAVLRSYATLELVEGNLAQGLDYASQAYAIYPEGDYVIDTYIVALAANGMMEEAQRLVEQYEKDYMFDDDLYDFLDGNMTLEEYYIG